MGKYIVNTLISGLFFFGPLVMAQQGTQNQIRFKLTGINRDATAQRLAKISKGQYELSDIASAVYEEEDRGFAITDEMKLNHLFNFTITAEYAGQFRSQVTLNDGRQFEAIENILFGYAGLSMEKAFLKHFVAFGLIGYGYYRDRVRGYNPANSELDPPEDTLYHTGNYEGFTAAFELGITWQINELTGLSLSYENTKILEVTQTALNMGFSIRY